jgi:hypothetical protein
MQADPACGPLFKSDDVLLGSDCQELERPQTIRQRLEAIARSRGPTTPRAIKAAQVGRARRLFSCLCRGQRCAVPDKAVTLEDDAVATDFLTGLLAQEPSDRASAWERELTCLSWAASAVQQHKAAGMEMSDALRCAFDDRTMAAAKEYVAVLKPRECR